ncbi:DUF1501 domain-containing protein [Lignipirellula cremea]|uniref:DUF1501 domain-containing protein n=1 Tax=Lignipirellula cremea TaxID=2528010 RepID=A0A518E2B0_9BACT|nr:DUF1501 domain-containing protein [Lignipirellula cremea]QDU98204.1 hypothetical protein Pla8534_60650 [Lignipirellula cremea]
MLHVGNERVPVCSGVNRRSFLQAGAAALGGLSLPGMMQLEAHGAVDPSKAKIKNCIVLFLVGSPGHLDTWDMKPDAPEDVRGKFKPIATRTPGIEICEHFPLMSQITDKLAFIRSLHHKTGASHENGQRWMMSGHDFNEANPQPHMGSVVSRVFGQQGNLPASIILPVKIGNTGTSTPHGQSAGQLGSAHEPFFLGSDPARSDFQVSDLAPPAGHSEQRLSARRNLLQQIDALQRRSESKSTLDHETAYGRAFNLLTSPKTKKAFDLSEEPDKLRDSYGRNTFGQSCLMSRRLIEHGARFVTVNHFDTVFNISCWDMHANGGNLNNTYHDYENLLCPQFDLAFTTLIKDLEDRGLLEETVVAVLSEFGRTPKINARGGRDHYPSAWTNFFAGGSIQGGQVIGSTDKIGAAPHDRPVTPPEVIASIYHGMGIDLETTMMPGPGGRPVRFIEAEPIRELF